jgi:TRAP-type transport system periplasmic protein
MTYSRNGRAALRWTRAVVAVMGVSLAFGAVAGEAGAAERPVKLTFSTWTGSEGVGTEGFHWFLREIQKRSEGRVEIDDYWWGTLIPLPNQVDGLGVGLADISFLFAAAEKGRMPLWYVTSLPAVSQNPMAAMLAQYDLAKHPAIEAEFRRLNITFVAGGVSAPRKLWLRYKVNSLDDLRGRKIRAIGDEAKLVRQFGAAPVATTSAEMYEAMERGIVDGAIVSIMGGVIFSVHEATKYLAAINFGSPSFGWWMNRDSWEKLPEKIQQIIREVAAEYPPVYVREYIKAGADHGYGKVFPERRIEVIRLPDEEFAKLQNAARGIWKEWADEVTARGLPGHEVLAEWLRLVQHYEKQLKAAGN